MTRIDPTSNIGRYLMTKEQLKEILAAHLEWLAGAREGKRAHLGGADLCGADLRGVNLRDADLHGANLGDADLGGADLCGVKQVIALGQPNGWWAFAYLWEGEIWVRIGCRTKSLADGRAYWADKGDRREVLAALDYAETVAKLRGWELKR